MSSIALSPILAPSSPPLGEVHSYGTYDPHSSEVSNQRWSRVWLVASLVTLVAFMALSGFGVAYTTLYAPVHLPITSVVIVAAGLPTSFRVFKFFWEKSEKSHSEALFAKEVKQELGRLEGKDLSQEFRKLGVHPKHQDPNHLNMILARHNALVSLRDKYLDLAHAVHNPKGKQESVGIIIDSSLVNLHPDQCRVSQVNGEDPLEMAQLKALNSQRVKALEWLSEAATYNIRAAHHLKVASDYRADGEESGVRILSSIPALQRLISQSYGDPTANAFLVKEGKQYTIGDVAEMTSARLYSQVFSGKSWWPFTTSGKGTG